LLLDSVAGVLLRSGSGKAVSLKGITSKTKNPSNIFTSNWQLVFDIMILDFGWLWENCKLAISLKVTKIKYFLYIEDVLTD
jgi:hypothetical protein